MRFQENGAEPEFVSRMRCLLGLSTGTRVPDRSEIPGYWNVNAGTRSKKIKIASLANIIKKSYIVCSTLVSVTVPDYIKE